MNDPLNTPESETYRDDAEQLTQSSDTARGDTTNRYAGGGPDDSSRAEPPAKGRQDWQSGQAPQDPAADARQQVESRGDAGAAGQPRSQDDGSPSKDLP